MMWKLRVSAFVLLLCALFCCSFLFVCCFCIAAIDKAFIYLIIISADQVIVFLHSVPRSQLYESENKG